MIDSETEVRLSLVEQNYQQLDKRLEKVEGKIDDLHKDIINGNSGLIKVIVGAASSIVASLLSVIIVMLMN